MPTMVPSAGAAATGESSFPAVTESGLRWRGADVVLTATWFGAMTGFAEVSARLAKMAVVDEIIRFDPNTPWLVPLAYAILFGCAGVLLSGLGRVSSRLGSPQATIGLFTFLGLWTGFLLYPRLHPLAVAALAAGASVQIARFAAGREAQFRRVIRRTLPVLVLLIGVIGASLNGWGRWTEQRALAALPPASGAGHANLLLLILDTVRSASLSAYGYDRATTPNLEKLAARGVQFDSAIATAPWTLTSHVSMFTGRYQFETSADWLAALDDADPTLAEVLGQNGYVSAGFVANRIFGTPEWGLDRGFVHYESYGQTPGQALEDGVLTRRVVSLINHLFGTYYSPGRKDAAALNSKLLRWLDGRSADRPFFAFVNYYDAHEPYVARLPGRPFAPTEPATRRIESGRRYTAEEIAGLANAYDDAIAYLDDQLGRLFADLDERGLLSNTLIIVASDHGEEFGEHGYLSHGNGLYLPSLHVPLLMALPGRTPAGLHVPEPVTLRDLPATVVEVLGLDARFPGVSLTRFWSAAPDAAALSPVLSEVNFVPNQPDWYPVAAGSMKALLDSGSHYIRNGDGTEEIYDLGRDPGQKRNLATAPEGQTSLQRLRLRLAEAIRAR